MHIKKYQQGVGLVEVLVAMLLLAIGVMGFAALQVKAVGATADSQSRTQAMTVMRGLSERMRANPDAFDTYPALITTGATALPTPVCSGAANTCTPQQMAAYDAYMISNLANQIGIKLSMSACPSLQFSRQCIYAAWNDTTPTKGTNTAKDCVDAQGRYNPASSCLVLETY